MSAADGTSTPSAAARTTPTPATSVPPCGSSSTAGVVRAEIAEDLSPLDGEVDEGPNASAVCLREAGDLDR
jgi:hypothetical protein